MAKASLHLIEKLRETAKSLESGADYSWGHVARCNCGHLAQTLLPLSSSDIYKAARSCGLDEWSEYANEYCPASGAPIDDIMDASAKMKHTSSQNGIPTNPRFPKMDSGPGIPK